MRKITDSLTIGNADDGHRHGSEFDRVVSLAAVTDSTTHEHPIDDGDHEYDEFEKAVTDVREGIEQGETVLVHCQAGLSRSVATAIAALVVSEGWEFDEAYEACRSGFIHPAPELIESAHRYIQSH